MFLIKAICYENVENYHNVMSQRITIYYKYNDTLFTSICLVASSYTIIFPSNNRTIELQFFFQLCSGLNIGMVSTVLWLQGDQIQKQPLVDTFGNILMWNGDIFRIENESRDECESDTSLLSRLLAKCDSSYDIISVMEKIHGPWAMVYYHKKTNCVWFGRDFFGRQSLLVKKQNNSIYLSSCVKKEMSDYKELPSYGLYSCELTERCIEKIVLYPWNCSQDVIENEKLEFFDCTLMNEPIKSPVNVKSNMDCLDVPCAEISKELFPQLLTNENVVKHVDKFGKLLEDAVKTRLLHQPNICKVCAQKIVEGESVNECQSASVGILFSGGLDSCVLAALASGLTPPNKPLYLYNVAFQQQNGGYDVPDRLTGLQAFKEIKFFHPDRNISLILVNVTLEELKRERDQRVKHLLHPLDTVLDDSIGCAIWFASRGVGVDSETGLEVKSMARVLLLGMGIDEQLGGYSRHRTSFERESWLGLASQLRRELINISSRNLGRDNRIVSDHGVAPRFPFLDENFVNFVATTIPLNLKCDFKHERGLGEKLILRLLAFKLGLVKTSREPKRAVQFGSRIAKMENRKEKGNQKAVR